MRFQVSKLLSQRSIVTRHSYAELVKIQFIVATNQASRIWSCGLKYARLNKSVDYLQKMAETSNCIKIYMAERKWENESLDLEEPFDEDFWLRVRRCNHKRYDKFSPF